MIITAYDNTKYIIAKLIIYMALHDTTPRNFANQAQKQHTMTNKEPQILTFRDLIECNSLRVDSRSTLTFAATNN